MGLGSTFPVSPVAIWTPYDSVTPDAKAWPIGNGKAMTQFSAGGYNASNPNASGVKGHNQILSVLDCYQNQIFGTTSGVAQAVSGQKQSVAALVAGIKAFRTSLSSGYSTGITANNAAGTRAPRILIKQMRAALDGVTQPGTTIGATYGGYYRNYYLYTAGAWVFQSGAAFATGGECELYQFHTIAYIMRLWMQFDVSSLGSWTGPIWYEIGTSLWTGGSAAYTTDWWVADGAQANAFTIGGSPVLVASAVNSYATIGGASTVWIPLGIYSNTGAPGTIGSSGKITVQARFTGDTTIIPMAYSTGPSFTVNQTITSAEIAHF